jgi:hypothetical protein
LSLAQCFIIMPFSQTIHHSEEYWNEHFLSRLKPLIESCTNLKVIRSEPLRQEIIRQIINDLVFSSVVIADLTDNNPNVYWELGVRQSFRHGTVTITEEKSVIPFDIASKSILTYKKEDFDGDSYFKKQLKKAVSDCISNPKNPDSAVLETITGRGSVYAVIRHEELTRRIDGLLQENAINRQLLKAVYNSIFESKSRSFDGLRSKYHIMTANLSSSALDSLLAEHYLEESSEFYEFCHILQTIIAAIRNEITAWHSSREPEKYLLSNQVYFEEILAEFNKKLVGLKEKHEAFC